MATIFACVLGRVLENTCAEQTSSLSNKYVKAAVNSLFYAVPAGLLWGFWVLGAVRGGQLELEQCKQLALMHCICVGIAVFLREFPSQLRTGEKGLKERLDSSRKDKA